MPFEVKSCFVRYLIDYGQLRVKRITFEGGVVKEMCSRDVLPVELLGQMCSIDILSELLGFEGWQIEPWKWRLEGGSR